MDNENSSYHNFKRLDILGLFMLIGGVIWELGWTLSAEQYAGLLLYFNIATLSHMIGVIGAYANTEKSERVFRLLMFEVIGCLTLLFFLFREDAAFGTENEDRAELIRMVLIIGLVTVPSLVSLTHVFQWLIRKQGKSKTGMPPAMQFVLSMVFVIMVGTGLLLMPNCTKQNLDFIDALFTSASAVSITGLCTVDFYNVFTFKGQIILLCLMQVGGLGVMTFAYFVAMISGQGFSLKDRVLFKDILDDSNMNQAVSFVRNIVMMTFGIELAGAVLLYFSWDGLPMELGGRPLYWHCLFHSVSAFCNSGFSSFPHGFNTEAYLLSKPGQATIMLMIVLGGLGFSVFYELRNNIIRFYTQKKKGQRVHITWTPYFKLVVCTTVVLIVGGALALLAVGHSSSIPMEFGDRAWLAFYDSVISRTAGFCLADPGAYIPSGLLVICALMMIGGCPGGTSGGIKTTVAAVSAGEVWRVLRGRKDVQFFKRSIAPDVIDRCLVTVVVSVAWVGASTTVCSFFDPNLSPLYVFFECCSAFSTTGLSCGITSKLSDPSKVMIILNMIAGRAGLFLFLMAIVGRSRSQYLHYPTVRIPLT